MKPTLRTRLPKAQGFTLIEVLVALGIVAIALMAGVQASSALTRNASRQADTLLGHLCAENELTKTRLSSQMPGVGDSTVACEQAGRSLQVSVAVRPTPNPNFVRINAMALDENGSPIVTLSTVVGRY
jgi:general secretion pathway protein I